MPQMAPMMWQIIFLTCIILLMISVSKNFFMNVSIGKTVNKILIKKTEVTWKW